MAGIYETQTILQLILDKGSLVSASKGIAEGFKKSLSGVGDALQGKPGGGIYGTPPKNEALQQAADLQLKSLNEDLKLTDIENEELSQLREIHKTLASINELEKLRGEITGEGVDIPEGKGGAGGGIGAILKGPILKALGPIAILAMIMSEILQFLRPFIKMFSLFMLILFIPVFRILKGFLKDLPSKMDAFKQAQTEAGGGLGGVAAMFMGFIGPLFDAFLQAIIMYNPISLFIGIVTFIIDALAKIDWNQLVAGLADSFVKLGGAIWNLAGELLGGLREWVDNLEPGIIKDVMNAVVTVFETGKQILEDFFTGEETLFDSINASLTKVVEWMGVGGLWEQIKTSVAGFMLTMYGSDGKSGLWGDITKALGDVKLALDESWKDIIDYLTEVGLSIKAAIDFINNLISRIKFWEPPSDNQGGGGGAGDFISRPGMRVQKFSPDDTIIGMKDLGKLMAGRGVTVDYRPTYRIDAAVDRDELRKIFDEHDEKVKRELESALSYPTNLRG